MQLSSQLHPALLTPGAHETGDWVRSTAGLDASLLQDERIENIQESVRRKTFHLREGNYVV